MPLAPHASIAETGLALTFLPGDPPSLAIDHGGMVHVWTLDGDCFARLRLKKGGRKEFLELGVHPTRLAGGVKKVRILDMAGQELGPDIASRKYCTGLEFSPNGSLLAAGFDNLRLVEVATGEVRWEALADNDLGGMAFSPDGTLLVATARSGGVHLLDVASGEVLASHEGDYRLARALPGGGYVVAGFRGELLTLDEDGAAVGGPPVPAASPANVLELEADEAGVVVAHPDRDRSWSDASFATGLAVHDGAPVLLAVPGWAPNKISHGRLGDLVLPGGTIGFRSPNRAEPPQALSRCGRWFAATMPNQATVIYAVDDLAALLAGA